MLSSYFVNKNVFFPQQFFLSLFTVLYVYEEIAETQKKWRKMMKILKILFFMRANVNDVVYGTRWVRQF